MRKMLLAVATVCGAWMVESAGAATSEPMRLDIVSGIRVAETNEYFAYDAEWSGVAGATYVMYVDGAKFAEGSGAGEVLWQPRRVGLHEVAHRAYDGDVKLDCDETAQFLVEGKDLVNATVTVNGGDMLYDGTPREPKVTVVYEEETLVEGTDYTLSYENNVEKGVGTIVITGKGRFLDEIEKSFDIVPAGVCSIDIESGVREAREVEPLTYDSAWNGSESVTYKMLVDGSEISTGSGVGEYNWQPRAVGNHTLTYRAYDGDYKVGDDMSAQFHVSGRDLVNATVTVNDTKILYDGTAREPKVTIIYPRH